MTNRIMILLVLERPMMERLAARLVARVREKRMTTNRSLGAQTRNGFQVFCLENMHKGQEEEIYMRDR